MSSPNFTMHILTADDLGATAPTRQRTLRETIPPSTATSSQTVAVIQVGLPMTKSCIHGPFMIPMLQGRRVANDTTVVVMSPLDRPCTSLSCALPVKYTLLELCLMLTALQVCSETLIKRPTKAAVQRAGHTRLYCAYGTLGRWNATILYCVYLAMVHQSFVAHCYAGTSLP